MLTRTQRSTLVFPQPFKVSGESRHQPAGTYLLEVEEELLEGLSFPAYRRIAMTITLQSAPPGTVVQALSVDAADLAGAQGAGIAG
ncbi:MAG TPA: hypothetical protein VE033_10645 [Acetobacteraceae bacterium]|jgi:hypothetical protein|nr:hypothetical protein [Acetobacteraceae bacterium]